MKNSQKFDYSLNYPKLNLRRKKNLYRVGKGEQGVLLVEPYKSEILPRWRFRTPAEAKKSAISILKLFKNYFANDDFIGMDMCRKFLQMGYTRSRRYANHKSGKKYLGPVPKNKKGVSGAHGRALAPVDADPVKARCAEIFLSYWKRAEKFPPYQKMKKSWKERLG